MNQQQQYEASFRSRIESLKQQIYIKKQQYRAQRNNNNNKNVNYNRYQKKTPLSLVFFFFPLFCMHESKNR